MNYGWRTATQLLQSWVIEAMDIYPGLPKRNPGLELANAFSVGGRLPLSSVPGDKLLTLFGFLRIMLAFKQKGTQK